MANRICPQSPFYAVLENTTKSGIQSENRFYFFCEKGQNITLEGKNQIAPYNKLGREVSIGKLMKFLTKYVNCGLVPVWNTNFRKKRAHTYMRKEPKCTLSRVSS
jgi:translation initiation factor 2 beta subunit (eIF-2beta)/eIF-5